MSWNQKYWDMLANIYWTRRYMGLESIPRKKWTTSQNHICIPKNEIPANTGIYVRKRAEAEQMAYLRVAGRNTESRIRSDAGNSRR